MPFDKTQPTNTTKIRNLGTVIRANWDAIELGDSSFKPQVLNLANRTPAIVPIDPVAVPNTYQLYCKQDSAGSAQLYGINQASTIVQISNAWAPVSAQNGYSWLAGGMLIQWGLKHANGGVNTLFTFPIPFSKVPYSIQLTQSRSTGGSATACYVVDDAGKAPTINNFNVYKEGGGQDVYWIAIGEKL